MKLVTFDDGRVGRIEGDRVIELDVPDMRTYYERGRQADETGETFALTDVTLRAPIIPKKFFHTAGNFREHHEESKNVNWSHRCCRGSSSSRTSTRSSAPTTRSCTRRTV